MRNKKITGFLTLAATAALILTACGGGNSSKKDNKVSDKEKASFLLTTTNKGKAIENGQLDIAIVNDVPFKGLFSPLVSQDAIDTDFMQPTGFGDIFDVNEVGTIVDGGPANFKLDRDTKVGTITFRQDLKWNDGHPVGADDFIFTMKFIADKDYTGVRYGNTLNVVGVKEYHDGKAKEITGLKKVDDYTVEITFTEVSPSLMQAGDGGVQGFIAPKHQLEKLSVKKAESSDAVRKNPLSFGPYYVSKVVPGETVELSVNPYYFGEKPKLTKIIEKNVASKSIVQSMQSKQYDIASMPTSSYDKWKNLNGYEILGNWEMSYTYLGFKLGKFDEKASENVYNPEAKMSNKALRQAMGYALDMDAVGEKFYHGLRVNANTLITPIFKELSATKKEVPGYKLDVKKAEKLLDDAGYKKGTDGLRTDPKGNKLTINFAFMSGGEIAEPLSKYYIQQWKSIGLDVQLTNGRLLDFQTFYKRVGDDDPEIDIYMGAWSLDWNPEPSGLYSKNVAFNFSRFVSAENTKLINAINSVDSFDPSYRQKAFIDWQKYASEEAFVIPLQFRYALKTVSNRVTNFDVIDSNSYYKRWESVGVSSADR